jgi:3-methyladenine DNA glycosylase/8-oxoguanine DNA glycosylase
VRIGNQIKTLAARIVANARGQIKDTLAKRKAAPKMTPEFEALVAAVTEQSNTISSLSAQIDTLVAVWNAPEPTAEQIVSVTNQVTANTAAIAAARDRMTALINT